MTYRISKTIIKKHMPAILAAILTVCGAIHDASASFLISDKNFTTVYVYDDSFVQLGSWNTVGPGNADPDDLCLAGGFVYVLDNADRKVYRYGCTGSSPLASAELRNTSGANITQAKGMVVDGDDLWVADDSPQIYKYSLSAAFSGGATVNALNQFSLDSGAGNTKIQGLAIDSDYLYALDQDVSRLFRYLKSTPTTATVSSVLRTSGSANLNKMEGALIEGDEIWIVNNDGVDTVNKFTVSSLFPSSGNVNATSTVALPGGSDPKGIGRDLAPLVASIVRVDTDPTAAGTVTFTITFSQSVTGVDITDFQLTTNGTLTGAQILSVSADTGSQRTITISTGTGSGALRLDFIDDDSVTGGCSQPVAGIGINNGDYTGGEEYEVDREAPSVTSLLSNDRVTLDIAFDDEMGPAALLPASYTVSGPGKGTLSDNPDTVTPAASNHYILTWLTGEGIATESITVTVDLGVEDFVGNVINPSANSASTTLLPVSVSAFSVE